MPDGLPDPGRHGSGDRRRPGRRVLHAAGRFRPRRRLPPGRRLPRGPADTARLGLFGPVRRRAHRRGARIGAGTYLAVTDIEAARCELAERGAKVSAIRHKSPVDDWKAAGSRGPTRNGATTPASPSSPSSPSSPTRTATPGSSRRSATPPTAGRAPERISARLGTRREAAPAKKMPASSATAFTGVRDRGSLYPP